MLSSGLQNHERFLASKSHLNIFKSSHLHGQKLTVILNSFSHSHLDTNKVIIWSLEVSKTGTTKCFVEAAPAFTAIHEQHLQIHQYSEVN